MRLPDSGKWLAGRALGDGAHHDAARQRHGITGDGKAKAVLVRPCSADLGPVGGFSFPADAENAVCWLGGGGLGGGHDLLLHCSPQGHLAAS